MEETFYTHALWRVKPGHEEEFIAAWKALADTFLHLPTPSSHGTLIQSLTDPTLFYSFGPWDRLEDIEAMRQDPQARQAIQDVMALCTEATPSSYRVVAEIRL
jgi:quinol monooxygenase YgiN